MYLALMFASTKLLCLCLYIVLYSKYHSMFLLFLFFFFFFLSFNSGSKLLPFGISEDFISLFTTHHLYSLCCVLLLTLTFRTS